MKELMEELTKILSPREKEVIFRRYGLKEEEPATLEDIGRALGVTRERVRQIQNRAIQKIKPVINSHPLIEEKVDVLRSFLNPLGIQEEFHFYNLLLKEKIIKSGEERFLKFLSLYHQRITYYPGDAYVKSFFSENEDLVIIFKHVSRKFYQYLLENQQEILSEDRLFHLIVGELKNHLRKSIKNEEVINFLRVIRHLHQNPFNYWGFIKNYHIVPVSLRHKIYLILKSENKPLHFSKIYEKIIQITQIENEFLHPSWKKSYSLESIKNELIKNPEFILIGRGTYVLKEWGYKRGYIIEVLRDFILKNKEVSFQEIYEFINNQRVVRLTTLNAYLYRLQKQGFIKIEGNIVRCLK